MESSSRLWTVSLCVGVSGCAEIHAHLLWVMPTPFVLCASREFECRVVAVVVPVKNTCKVSVVPVF